MNDLILVGGGLASGLIALRLRQARPGFRVVVVERADKLGAGHTWSFHGADLTDEQLAIYRPLVARSWPAYSVSFPERTRVVGGGYHSIVAESFHRALADSLGDGLRLGTEASGIEPDRVRLADGSEHRARCVIDARGFPEDPGLPVAYQKFVGLDVEIEGGHGLEHPVLMDATVEQMDGFRFFYLLPWDATRLLIEDTRYSDNPRLEKETFRSEIRAYATRRGWKIRSVAREEAGVLPLPLGGSVERLFRDATPGVGRVGTGAGFLHATTGYSFPQAIAVAEALAAHLEAGAGWNSAAVGRLLGRLARAHWNGQAYYRLLNRLLFQAAAPTERYRVLQKFYGFPDRLIQRFYSGRMTGLDRARVFTGRPPVPVLKAMKCLL